VSETLAAVIGLRELVDAGRRRDGSLPADVVAEIEITLEGLKDNLSPQPIGARCKNCGLRVCWPGDLDTHSCVARHGLPEHDDHDPDWCDDSWQNAEAA
jgi:hypothetical protein